MEQGVSGYFDLAGTENFTGRFFYSEEYEKSTGKRKVSITGISIQSTVYGGTWYPGGTVAVEGETLCTMEYEGKVTHQVSVGASEDWKEVTAVDMWGLYFPWTSGEIASEADGSKSVTFDVDIKLWRSTDNYTVAIKGSYTVDLTKLTMGPRAWLRKDGEYLPVTPRVFRDGGYVQPRPVIK